MLTRLGKPAGGDLRAGVVTVPVLLAARQWPELARLTRSRAPADLERAHKLVLEVLYLLIISHKFFLVLYSKLLILLNHRVIMRAVRGDQRHSGARAGARGRGAAPHRASGTWGTRWFVASCGCAAQTGPESALADQMSGSLC